MKGSTKDHVSAKSLKDEITGKIKAAINSAGGLAAKSIEKKIEKASKKLAHKVIKASRKIKKGLEKKMRKSDKSSSKGLKIASRKLASSKLGSVKSDVNAGILLKPGKKSSVLAESVKELTEAKPKQTRGTSAVKSASATSEVPAAPVKKARATVKAGNPVKAAVKVKTPSPVKTSTASKTTAPVNGTVKPKQTRTRKAKGPAIQAATSVNNAGIKTDQTSPKAGSTEPVI